MNIEKEKTTKNRAYKRKNRIGYILAMAILIASILILVNATHILTPIPTPTWKPISLRGGGAIMSVAIDTNSPNVVYAATDLSGIYKSTDYGMTWISQRTGLKSEGDWNIAALAINPNNSNQIFMGSGEVWGHPSGDYGGIFQSKDGGQIWTLVSRDLKFSGHGDIRQSGDGLILFDKKNTSIIYAVTIWDGIFKSIDGGSTWLYKGLSGKYLTGIVINEAGEIFVSAGMRGTDTGGIYKSLDNGNTWMTLNNTIQANKLVVSGSIIYVASKGNGIYKSTDDGTTWNLKNNGLFVKNFVGITMSSSNPSIVYAVSEEWENQSTGSLFRTINGGDNWSAIPLKESHISVNGWWKDSSWFSSGSYSLTMDPTNSNRIYLADAYTVWRSDDGGITWSTNATGLETMVVTDIKVHPLIPNFSIISVMDNTGFISYDGGKTNNKLEDITDSDIWSIAYAPGGSKLANLTVYAATGRNGIGNLWKSVNGGKNWTKLSMPSSAVKTVVVVSLSNALYVSIENDYIYKSSDGGNTWTRLTLGLPRNPQIVKIITDPINADNIYILDRYQGVYKSINGGENWTSINAGFNGELGSIYDFKCLAIDQNSPSVLYAGGVVHGLYKSIDGGLSWNQIFDNFSCGVVFVSHNSVIYAGGMAGWWYDPIIKKGLYVSKDGGDVWNRIDNHIKNIPLNYIGSMADDPFQDGVLYVGTEGGAYKYD